MTESNNPLEYEIREAFLGVSAPADVKQRLLARVREEAGASSPLSDAVGEALRDGQTGDEPIANGDGVLATVSPVTDLQDEVLSNSRRVPRRFLWVSAVTAVVLAAFGLFFWPASPMSRQDVAHHGIQLASALDDGLVAADSWDLKPSWPFASQLKVSGVLGYARVSSKHFGGTVKQCDVWKVTDNRSDFYVIEVPDTKAVAEIIGVFRTIPSSGGWSIAAMQTADSLVLVIGRSDVDNLIRQGQYT